MIEIMKTGTRKRIIEINGKEAGFIVPPENYRLIYSISTRGTIQLIMIEDKAALRVAREINTQLNQSSSETI